MIFWRPAYEWRGTRQHWTHLIKPGFDPRGLAEKLIAQAFGVFIPKLSAANDRDNFRW